MTHDFPISAETKATRTPDLRFSSVVSLAMHALLLLIVGVAVTHSRAQFTPPTLQTIRLDVDLASPVSTENAQTTPSASPVNAAVPQVVAPPRPAAAMANEERLMPSATPQDVAPTAPDSVDVLVSPADGVATFVSTETSSKRIFGSGAEGVLHAIPSGPTGPAGSSGNGFGIEGPISLRNGMKPLYPLGARQRGEEGTVVLETTVTPDGHASAIAVISSSRFTELDRAAVKSVEHAVFNPASENGHAVAAQARITIIFRLTN